MAAGGKVRIGAEVGQSVYAAGGQVNINGKVGRNLRVAGGQVELGPKADVTGNVSAAGGQVRLYGAVRGHVQAAGGRLLIDGPITGDVLATSGQVELAARAHHRKAALPQRRCTAEGPGGASEWRHRAARAELGWRRGVEPAGARARGPRARRGRHRLALDRRVDRAGRGLAGRGPHPTALAFSRTLRERAGLSVVLGFVWLVCVPVLALLLLLTVIGIPLALFVAAVYLAVLPLAYVAAAVGLGDWALTRWQATHAATSAWRVGVAALALVLLLTALQAMCRGSARCWPLPCCWPAWVRCSPSGASPRRWWRSEFPPSKPQALFKPLQPAYVACPTFAAAPGELHEPLAR